MGLSHWVARSLALGATKREGSVKVMLTRRDVLKQAGTVAALATTAPWWLVRRAHAARREKLIVWSQSP